MESEGDVEDLPDQVTSTGDGPWSILWCGLAGIIGMTANWLFGSQTLGGYLVSCAVFAGLMYAILWAARRSSEDLEN